MREDAPILSVPSTDVWEEWLSRHYTKQPGVWLKIAKKASGLPTVSHDDVLDVALCYGWIDGLRRSCDETFFLQKFTPRRRRSNWSVRNIARATQLIASGRMQPSGLAEIEAAKQDGRWHS